MLGTRTKHVFSYGKRNHRIVNISDDRDDLNNDQLIPERPTLWAPVASRMKKRENKVAVKEKSNSPSPKVFHVQKKKKRPSPVLSPPLRSLAIAKKRTRAQDVIDTKNIITPTAVDSATPIRRPPLGTFTLNVPNESPGETRQKKRRSNHKPTPRGLTKPFSPFVDVDITVLDDEGRTISQERRVSRTDVQVNLTSNREERGLLVESRNRVVDLCNDSTLCEAECSIVPGPKPKKPTIRRAAAGASGDSEPDIDHAYQTECLALSTPQTARLQPRSSRLPVEAIAPAPTSRISPIKPSAFQPRKHDVLPSQASDLSPGLPAPLLKYQYVPSPVARPRQLTPIRGGRNNCLFVPPSPSSTTDFDLSLDFSELSIDDIALPPPSLHSQFPQPHQREIKEESEHLRGLLAECAQEKWGPHEFSAFIEMFPFDPIVWESRSVGRERSKFRKIGEASYSEVFGIGDVVLKVIPLRDEGTVNVKGRTPTQTAIGKPKPKYGERNEIQVLVEEGPPPSDAKDVLKEVIVTRAMGDMCEGFVKLLRTYVVRGRYPEVLLDLWDEYYEKKGSESIRPDTFNVSQTYAIIVLPNGGPDLEAYTFTSASRMGWRQACSLFWQVTRSLAQAEQLVSFEHRDLHWGQILVKDIPCTLPLPLKAKKPAGETPNIFMDELAYGVKATLIDLGLSRMDAGDGQDGVRVHWTPFAEEIFMGEGEYQFDIYRIMREHNGGAWEGYRPLTNVMWLHYLSLKLLHSKRLKPPPASRKQALSTPATTFTERDCYSCLVEIEKVLERCVDAARPKPEVAGRGRKKTLASKATNPGEGPQSASEVIGYGLKRGWVR